METTQQSPRLPRPQRITEQTWPEGTVPIVSVFSWTYNHVAFIRESMDSILMQETTFPIEIIIHDDASTDGTTEIIREYEAKYPQLFRNIIQQENQWSQGKSVMAPMFAAPRGEFIALTHGDDFWTSESKLQLQWDILEKDVACQGSCHDTSLLSQHTPSSPDDWFQNFGDRTILNFSDIAHPMTPFHTSSFMYRKSVYLKEYPFVRRSLSGDRIIFALVASRGPIRRIPSIMSCYRKHAGGITESLPIKDQLRLLSNRVAMWQNISSVILPEHAKTAKVTSKTFETYLLSAIKKENRPNRLLFNIIREELGLLKAITYLPPILKLFAYHHWYSFRRTTGMLRRKLIGF